MDGLLLCNAVHRRICRLKGLYCLWDCRFDSLLLKAYIGFLSEEATVDEQSFPMVKELLSYTQGSKEDGEKDAIDCLMEDTVSRTHRHREYYNNYQRYRDCSAWCGCAAYLFPAEWCDFAGYGIFD